MIFVLNHYFKTVCWQKYCLDFKVIMTTKSTVMEMWICLLCRVYSSPWAGSERWGGSTKRAVAQRGVSETHNCQVLWELWCRKATGEMGRAGEAPVGVTQQCKAQQFSPGVVLCSQEISIQGYACLGLPICGELLMVSPLRVSKYKLGFFPPSLTSWPAPSVHNVKTRVLWMSLHV